MGEKKGDKFKMYLQPMEIGSIIVAVEVYKGEWKAKVIHGHQENEYAYGRYKDEAIAKLKEKILNQTSFKHWKFIIV